MISSSSGSSGSPPCGPDGGGPGIGGGGGMSSTDAPASPSAAGGGGGGIGMGATDGLGSSAGAEAGPASSPCLAPTTTGASEKSGCCTAAPFTKLRGLNSGSGSGAGAGSGLGPSSMGTVLPPSALSLASRSSCALRSLSLGRGMWMDCSGRRAPRGISGGAAIHHPPTGQRFSCHGLRRPPGKKTASCPCRASGTQGKRQRRRRRVVSQLLALTRPNLAASSRRSLSSSWKNSSSSSLSCSSGAIIPVTSSTLVGFCCREEATGERTSQTTNRTAQGPG